MKITAITATWKRPEAMTLCEKYIRRQTRQPDQWLILTGPDPMPRKVLRALENGDVEGDLIAFIEDDDYFRPDWLEWVEKKAERGYDLIGEGHAVYYHVRNRWWSECFNVHHASLCSTAITSDLFEPLCNIIKSYESPFFDTRIWQVECNRFLALPKTDAERRVIGIKGMPGTAGYSGEHTMFHPVGSQPDPSGFRLWQLLGQDAEPYMKFYHG
jgi:hypothetical protein